MDPSLPSIDNRPSRSRSYSWIISSNSSLVNFISSLPGNKIFIATRSFSTSIKPLPSVSMLWKISRSSFRAAWVWLYSRMDIIWRNCLQSIRFVSKPSNQTKRKLRSATNLYQRDGRRNSEFLNRSDCVPMNESINSILSDWWIHQHLDRINDKLRYILKAQFDLSSLQMESTLSLFIG